MENKNDGGEGALCLHLLGGIAAPERKESPIGIEIERALGKTIKEVEEIALRDNVFKEYNIVLRAATLADVDKLAALEEGVWGESGASKEKIVSRMNIFPEGNIIAECNGRVIGYVCVQHVGCLKNLPDFTWDQITSNGTLAESHNPKGDYSYGINLSVHYKANGLNISDALVMYGLAVMVRNNKRGGFIGSRIPGFKSFLKHHPDSSIDDYVSLRRKNGKLRDYELSLYEEAGFRVVKILPNYFPDPASLNYGALVYKKNPFYNWPLSRFWAWVIEKKAISTVKKKLAKKRARA